MPPSFHQPRCYLCQEPISIARIGEPCEKCEWIANEADPRRYEPDDDPASNEDGWHTGRAQ